MFIIIYEDFYTRIWDITEDKILVLSTYEEAKKVYEELKMDLCYFGVRIIYTGYSETVN